jgi:hypothetical protein
MWNDGGTGRIDNVMANIIHRDQGELYSVFWYRSLVDILFYFDSVVSRNIYTERRKKEALT